MSKFYTVEKNALTIISLLKSHGIRRVIASPGTTNMPFVASIQFDPYFEVYSSVDERSAAYMACGLAAETGEPVVISCTGATASRNYLSGLTEAFYRKLPVLAITSTQAVSKVGHHVAQVIDRSSSQNDVSRLSVTLPIVKDDDDLWECEIKVNQAILELSRNGGGPVHINLPTQYSKSYDVKELPKSRVINRVKPLDEFPSLPKGKTAVFVGARRAWTQQETDALDKFCSVNNAVVFCDHTSSYKGKYRLLYSLASCQKLYDHTDHRPNIVIHIGEISGDYASLRMIGRQVWRVSEDGEIRDSFRRLSYVFEMPEKSFFDYYGQTQKKGTDSYLKQCKDQLSKLRKKIPELPFSNIWVASKISHRIPKNSSIHFGILNSLRSWNFFEIPPSVESASNVGGFGIDGGLSSLVGASLARKERLFFGVIGDLVFFYDMNVMGNRHVGNNLRILLINNGKGTEFRQYGHVAYEFGDDADKYISAAGHFGNKSPTLVKNYAENLGFDYISASNKQEFAQVCEQFLVPEVTEKPMLLEVFTDSIEESRALELVVNIDSNIKGKAKKITKDMLGKNSINILKKLVD